MNLLGPLLNIRIQIPDGYMGSLGSKPLGRSQTDSTGTTSDDRNVAGNLKIHLLLLKA